MADHSMYGEPWQGGDEAWLDPAGSGSGGPGGRTDFRTTDWLIAAGTTAIVAVCICAGVISMRPWNDASFVRAIDGCAFKTLCGQNILDSILSLVFLGTRIESWLSRQTNIAVPSNPTVLVCPQATAFTSEWHTTRIRPHSCRYSSLLAYSPCSSWYPPSPQSHVRVVVCSQWVLRLALSSRSARSSLASQRGPSRRRWTLGLQTWRKILQSLCRGHCQSTSMRTITRLRLCFGASRPFSSCVHPSRWSWSVTTGGRGESTPEGTSRQARTTSTLTTGGPLTILTGTTTSASGEAVVLTVSISWLTLCRASAATVVVLGAHEMPPHWLTHAHACAPMCAWGLYAMDRCRRLGHQQLGW